MGDSLKGCRAWHAGDGGIGRDTTLGRMDERRGTGHLGTGTYFVSDADKLGSARADRGVRCIPLEGANLYRPATDADAQRLFDALAAVNRTVAGGLFATGPRHEDEEAPTDAELDDRFSALYQQLKAAVPAVHGKSVKIAGILEDASDAYADCRRGDADACALDSASTRIMRAAGFDGVDVRGLERFDNTFHGSVLYRPRGGR